MKFANITTDKLIEMDPSNSKYYISNSQRYNELLKELDEGIKKSVDTIPRENRKLLTYHDSWAYFALRYGMTVIGAIQPSDFGEPSPQDVARLIDQIRTENIPGLFASEVFPTNIIDQIAKEANVTIVETLVMMIYLEKKEILIIRIRNDVGKYEKYDTNSRET
jgi:ABC-type Zn uptake system ZnuABC Zn-binding protein ZnuA